MIEGQLGGLGLEFLLGSISSGVFLGLPQVDLPQYHHLLVQHLAAGALLTVHCCVLLDSLILMLGGGRSLGLGGKAAATSWNSGELLRTNLAGAEFLRVRFCGLRQSHSMQETDYCKLAVKYAAKLCWQTNRPCTGRMPILAAQMRAVGSMLVKISDVK